MERADLVEYFEEHLFVPQLKARNKDGVLQELIDVLVTNSFIRNREIVLEMLRKRELLGSTGIGKGIAIPHGRTTAAPRVVIVFGRSEEGIPFDSIDGQPVYLIFMIISPPAEEGNVYLPILGKLVTVLNSDQDREMLKHATNFSDFIKIIKGEVK